MLEVYSVCAWCIFWPPLRFVSTFLDVFRPCSPYVLTVLTVCFNHARGIARPFPRNVSTVCDMFLIMITVCFDYDHAMFRAWLRYVSIVITVCFNWHHSMFRPCSYSLSVPCAHGMFGPCLKCLLIVLELCFDRAWSKFRSCSRYVQCVLEVYFDSPWGMFWPCSGCILALLAVVPNLHEVHFECSWAIIWFNCARVCSERARMFCRCSSYASTVLELSSYVLCFGSTVPSSTVLAV